MTLSGDWGYAKDPLRGAPFHLLLSGKAVVEDDLGGLLSLGPGDMAILPRGNAHRLLHRRGAPVQAWRTIVEAQGWTPWQPGTRFKAVDLHLGSGRPTATLISGVFDFDEPLRHPLLEALPPMLLLRGRDADGAPGDSAAAARLLETELLSDAPGAEPVATRLADMLFVQAVRQHLATPSDLRGWLRGLAAPDLAPVLAAVHHHPGRGWTLRSLCETAGMSRSRFAERFQAVVGMTPKGYVTEQRMFLATRLLDRFGIALTDVAAHAGYASVFGFSRSFRRWSGMTPSEYRLRRAGPPTTQRM